MIRFRDSLRLAWQSAKLLFWVRLPPGTPHPFQVEVGQRLKVAGDIASHVPFAGKPTWQEQQRRLTHPVMYLFYLLQAEQADRVEAELKIRTMQALLEERGREISQLKRGR